MSDRTVLNIDDVRAKLAGKNGKEFWRSLDEIAETEQFKQFLEKEFPREASSWGEGYSRRDFMKVMGASLSLAGLTACVKQPEEKIVPYVKAPEQLVPGKPQQYATAFVLGGYAHGVLATSHMGRPTHIAGNPDHPASLGSADIFATASLLNLYDPDRSQVVLHKGEPSSYEKFLQHAKGQLDAQRALKGAGLRILTQNITSPTLGAQLQSILAQFPEAKWHQYEPCGLDNAREGARMAFGEYLHTRYHFEKADLILSLDADFLSSGPGCVRYAHDFADRRRVGSGKSTMNRLYCAESTPTITGGKADHRFRMKASEVEAFARAVAAKLGVTDVNSSGAVDAKAVEAVAKDMLSHKGSSIVVAGSHQPASVHALAHAMNAMLGNVGNTVEFTSPVEVRAENHLASITSLVEDINRGPAAGGIDVLLILDGNPVYDAPSDLKFAEVLEKVKFSVRLGSHDDETSEKCEWHIPQSHFLECWSDARAFDGTATIMQPLIVPLYATKSSHELLDDLFGSGRNGMDIVKSSWSGHSERSEESRSRNIADFNSWWRKSLNDGVVAGTTFAPKAVKLASVERQGLSLYKQGMEIIFRLDPSIYDGRFANNGWLQELPKHITRNTWTNVALMSPSSIQKLGLKDGDVVELALDGEKISAPAWTQPGHPDDAVTLHLGYGRKRAGRVGTGIGANAYALRSSKNLLFARGVEIKKTGEWYNVPCTQDHWSMDGRPIVRTATLDEYKSKPEFAKEMAHRPTDKESFYPPYEYDGYAWGMTIDLNACTGCNACVMSCVSENNIPVVGEAQVANGREMHWIRIDRYYSGDLDNPETHMMPVACQHCENAPCEPVCPVAATTHDHEGLNVMTYNRCVGTRYCSNNCPYKVRRYNFIQYSDTETPTYQLMRNPDVTVRNRGVMEKCTYCVQRISAARIEAKKENRLIRDGEVMTACQAACPAQAITFGDINDKNSKVSKMKAEPRDYGLLAELNTKPRTSYLAKITNPNRELLKKDDVF
jgi:molybdopterin-containing oxidoreductase family iron-sulfur binding subunit